MLSPFLISYRFHQFRSSCVSIDIPGSFVSDVWNWTTKQIELSWTSVSCQRVETSKRLA